MTKEARGGGGEQRRQQSVSGACVGGRRCVLVAGVTPAAVATSARKIGPRLTVGAIVSGWLWMPSKDAATGHTRPLGATCVRLAEALPAD